MKIWNLTKKDLAVILKDRGSFTWLFILPIVFTMIYAILAGMAFKDAGGSAETETDARTPLPVVNLDLQGDLAQRFISDLDQVGGFRPELIEQSTAEARLKTIQITRYLVIPPEFSANLAAGKPVEVSLVTHPEHNQSGTANALRIVNAVARDISLELQLLDGIRQMGEMQAGNPESQQAFNAERTLAQAKSQFERSRTTPLISVAEQLPAVQQVAQTDQFDFNSTIVPGMVVLFVFLSASTVAHNIFEERKNGSLRRLLAAPLTRSELMFGKMVPIWLLSLVQIIVVFAVGAIVLPLLKIGRLTIGESPLAWAVTSIVIALCSTSLGIMIASLARTEGQVSGGSNAMLWIAGFLGGALLPSFMIQQIPVLKILQRFVPQFWATTAYYDILARGAGLLQVLPGLAALLVFTAVFFFIGVRRFRFE